MAPWKKYKINEHLRFFGKAVQHYFAWSILIGLLLFVIEFAFAQLLQIFLFKLDIGTAISTHHFWDQYLLGLDLFSTILFVVLAGTLRAVFQGLRSILWQKTMDIYLALQRTRLIQWVFSSRSINSAEAILLFTERANRSASAVGALQQIILQGVTLTFLVASLFVISTPLTGFAIAALGLLGVLMRNYNLRVGQTGRSLVEEWNKLNAKLILSMRNLLLIQIYGTEREEEALALQSLNTSLNHYLNFSKYTVVKSTAPQVLGIFILCAIAYFAKTTGSLQGPALLSYFYLFIRFVQNFSELSVNLSNLRLSWPQVIELFNWWELKSRTANSSSASTPQATTPPHPFKTVGWNCSQLSFRYSDRHPWLFENLNLSVKAGEMLTILGPSGQGKTTLLNLLIGTLQPTAGIIDLTTDEGVFALQAERPRLLASLGYVGPETFLIEGSIRENLFYGLKNRAVRDEDINAALQAAECDFVSQLKDGLDHFLTEQGQGLSAGQKQRLALARALLRNPKALILDEATSNLDGITEKRLVQSLAKLKGKMTIIAVTHREPLTAIADNVLHLSREI